MNVFGKSLFYSGHNPTLEDVLCERKALAIKTIKSGLLKRRGEDLVGKIGSADLAQFLMTPLQLNVSDAANQTIEAEVDVSRRLDYGHRARITGFRISKILPFSGDRALWGLETSNPERDPPKANIEEDKLIIGALVPKPEAQLAHEEIAATLEKILRQLTLQETQIARFNSSLAAAIEDLFHSHRHNVTTSSGFPLAI